MAISNSVFKKLCLTSISLSILCCFAIIFNTHNSDEYLEISQEGSFNPLFNMPIVENDPLAHLASKTAPVPQRTADFKKWLQVSVRIRTSGSMGSGTIIYYDKNENWAYIQTCGHLWGSKVMSAEEGKRQKLKCKIDTWYHNDKKLDKFKTYSADIIYTNNEGGNGGGRDVALLRFKPDWSPNYIPIAPKNLKIPIGTRLHSCGSDAGEESAHYDVRHIGLWKSKAKGFPHFMTTENSPRPGRSGGGLMDDSYYVGICWGTSNVSGNGNGYFTPLGTIRYYNEINGYGWLNEAGYSFARDIPIIDRNNPQKKYPKDYIPLPM